VLSLDGEEFQEQVLITDEVYAEWITFHHYIAKQPKEDMSSQLYDLSTNETLKPMFPQFAYLGQCLYVTSSWDSISGEKLFKNKNDKTQLRNRLSEKSFLLNENLNRIITKIS